MKVRKLAIALALAGTMGSNLAYALGLGDAEIKSNLNEPLRAEIELVGVGNMTGDEVIANLAPERDFRKIGIEPMFFLNEIQFKVVKNARGELVLQLTTNKPVREPYLNFLVEVAWPSGRLLREYALLIDPPVFRDSAMARPTEVAATPPTPARQQPQTPRQAARPSASDASAGPTGNETPATTARVSSSDTLWSIAVRVRPADDLTPQQVMLALQDANPDAFIRNNINLVREGSILRIPSEDQIRSRSRREAVQQVNAQNRLFRQPDQGSQVAAIEGAKPRTNEAAPSAAPVATGDELRLLAGDSARAEDGSHGGAMGGSGTGTAETRLAMTLEELDQSRRENEELNSRLDDLHEQLASMQRLLELKNDRLASMQAEAGMQAEPVAAASADPEVVAENASNAGQALDAAEPMTADAPAPVTGEVSDEPTLAADASDVAQLVATAGSAGPVGEAIAAAQQASAADSDGNTLAQSGADGTVEDGTVSVTEQAAASADRTLRAVEPVPVAAVEEVTSAGTLQQLMGDPLYQTVAGATGATGVAVLALLGFLARRRTRREEEEFYAQLQQEDEAEETAADSDAFATSLHAAGVPAVEDFEDDAVVDTGLKPEDTLEAGSPEHEDPAAEADVHLAYGGFDQAARVLEDAVSAAPERSDLRLKLLEVYAAVGDEDGFALQMSEFEAVNDDAVARAEAESLRERLTATLEVAGQRDPDTVWGLSGSAGADPSAEDESGAADFDFDLGLNDSSAAGEPAGSAGIDELALDDTVAAEGEDELEFNLDESEFEAALAEDGDDGLDLSDAELDALDLDGEFESDVASATAAGSMSETGLNGHGDATEAKAEHQRDRSLMAELDAGAGFDESFLEELDAELDKVSPDAAVAQSDAALGDLELDLSDDLAVIGQASDGESNSSAAEPVSDRAVDGLPDLDLAFGGSEGITAETEEVPTLDNRAIDDGEGELAVLPRLETDRARAPAASSDDFNDSLLEEDGKAMDALSESDLDDDFDFLDADEAGTKLDLARAYVEMGDAEGAREILEEVSLEGSDIQKEEARGLLEQLS